MATNWFIISLLLAASIYNSEQISTPNSTYYTAAVVEFAPKYINDSTCSDANRINAKSTLQANALSYETIIAAAGSKEVDIIVFPEDGLTAVYLPDRRDMEPWSTLIPAPADEYVPCDQNTIDVSENLKKISCAAKHSRVYVVVNIAEKQKCIENGISGGCPPDKLLFYNTNVVFDRNGKVIAKYRKTHLFYEPYFNVTAEPEVVTFDTDFGVTFGTFICFDILYKEPAITLTRKRNVTDIVYPAAWFSQAPFLTAVQTQAAWSFAEDVNLLASGYNRPKFGNGGSGIYLGRKGIAEALIQSDEVTQTLIYKVPKIKRSVVDLNKDHTHGDPVSTELNKSVVMNNSSMRSLGVSGLKLKYEDLSLFETFPFSKSLEKTTCHKNFCCEFNIQMTNVDPETHYRLVAFDGVVAHAQTHLAGTSVCAVVQCTNESISSCGTVRRSWTTFNAIQITGTFHNDENLLVMPSSIDSNLLPLINWSLQKHYHEEHVHVLMSLDGPVEDIVAFGLYAREFDRDRLVSSALSTRMWYSLLTISPLLLILY